MSFHDKVTVGKIQMRCRSLQLETESCYAFFFYRQALDMGFNPRWSIKIVLNGLWHAIMGTNVI